jgi:hypothetical protein
MRDVLETIAVERIEDRLDELEGASRHGRTTHDQAHLRPQENRGKTSAVNLKVK